MRYVYVIGWSAVVLGINCTRNAGRKANSTHNSTICLPACITSAINPKYYSRPSYYIYISHTIYNIFSPPYHRLNLRWEFRRTPCQVALPRSVASQYVYMHSTCDTDVKEPEKWARGRGGGSALSATKVRGCCPLYPSSPTPLILTRFPHKCRPCFLSS